MAEVVRAEPELAAALLPGRPSPLLWVLGKRNYGRTEDMPSDISAETFLVRCDDRALCRAFAGLYQRVAENGRPKGFCSKLSPHATSAEWPMPLDKLRAVPRAQPHATCGRYRACLAHEGAPRAACDRAVNRATHCAEIESCKEALACFANASAGAGKIEASP